jgi:hypothetical protein
MKGEVAAVTGSGWRRPVMGGEEDEVKGQRVLLSIEEAVVGDRSTFF